MSMEKETKFDISVNLLVSCMDNGEELVIPGEHGGSRIKKIAAGCSAEKNTRTIKICEGIERIGSRAFEACSNVTGIELPASLKYCHDSVFGRGFFNNPDSLIKLKRRFSFEEYERLMKKCIRLCDGRYLLAGDYADDIVFSEIYRGFGGVCPAVRLEKEMCTLFLDDGRGIAAASLVFAGYGGLISSADTACDMIKADIRTPDILEAEQANDSLVISGKKTQPGNVIIAYYNDKDVEKDGKDIIVNISLRFMKAFYPGIETVSYEDRDYYLFKRMYLSSDTGLPVLKVTDFSRVYDNGGRAVSGETAERVKSKYRLLSMI